MAVEKFDYEQARALGNQIKKSSDDMKTTINTIQGRVDTCREWWAGEGNPQESFINNFKTSSKKIEKGIEEWLSQYNELMKQVEQFQKERSKSLSNSLRNN